MKEEEIERVEKTEKGGREVQKPKRGRKTEREEEKRMGRHTLGEKTDREEVKRGGREKEWL
ncbi:MAG: hypothetical protein ABW098_18935 [Candidatus Thiodiazotropha sp.]